MDKAYREFRRAYVDEEGQIVHYNVTISGKPSIRLPEDYPYSYSDYCVYKNGYRQGDNQAWSDRLMQQYPNYSTLWEEICGTCQFYIMYPPEQISKFLSTLFGEEVILTGMEQSCNACNGYPYWVLYYRKKENT